MNKEHCLHQLDPLGYHLTKEKSDRFAIAGFNIAFRLSFHALLIAHTGGDGALASAARTRASSVPFDFCLSNFDPMFTKFAILRVAQIDVYRGLEPELQLPSRSWH
jgi:hypothetical protein